jgi:1-acyl-sn-glycerol-3-phosphate acyltransferase
MRLKLLDNRSYLDNRVARTVFSAWAWLVLAACLIVWLPLVAIVRLVTLPFDKGRYAAGWLFRRQAVVIQALNPLWRFKTHGDHPKDMRRPYVVVSNHESFVDMLLISHLPWEMKWLSKSEFFKIPFIGWQMSLAGDVKLVRGDAKSVVTAMKDCAVWLDREVSVMIFPEGTRSVSGELGEFKEGAFRLAVDKQLPVLPLVVHGSRSALRKHDWRFGVSNADVYVLDPIETTGLTRADVPELRDRVRELIAGKLAEVS